LVEAFHSTLEEVENAHLLLHVVDVSAEDSQLKVDEVNTVLKEIDANNIPTIIVYNKIDRTELEPRIELSKDDSGNVARVWLSAHSGSGIGLLVQTIETYLQREFRRLTIQLAAHQSKVRAQLYERNVVQSEEILEDGSICMDLKMSPADYGWLQKQSTEFFLLSDGF